MTNHIGALWLSAENDLISGRRKRKRKINLTFRERLCAAERSVERGELAPVRVCVRAREDPHARDAERSSGATRSVGRCAAQRSERRPEPSSTREVEKRLQPVRGRGGARVIGFHLALCAVFIPTGARSGEIWKMRTAEQRI